MMDQVREAAVWERVRSSSAAAPQPEKKEEPTQERAQNSARNNRSCRGSGFRICGGLPALVLAAVLFRGR